MKSTLIAYIDRFTHDRHQRVMLGSVLFILSVMVTLLVYWQLRYVGITMTNATYCGYEEHVHTEECYEKTLVCGLEESEGHTHTEECYEEQSVLVCGLEESEGHTHTEECYDEEGNLICGLEESEGHTHTDECYETQSVLICELEESEGHTHTDECYEYTLICGLEEHTHTAECMVDETADLEDYSIWEATIPALTGDLRTDVVNIAYSQLGYTESVANYVLGEDGVTHMGYTRYGTWYGSSYSDWDSMFVAFCLDYAGIADEFTYNAGAYAWSVDLTTLGYYQTADIYTPSVGDVVFIDTDDDGKANVTAIVVAVDETAENITVIQGNYAVEDADGDTVDTVSLVVYSTAASGGIVTLSAGSTNSTTILGYANVAPETASEEVISEDDADVTGDASEDESENESEEEVALDEEIVEEITESVAEENASEEATSEESASEGSSTSDGSAEEATEEVTEEESSEENLLLTSVAADYTTQVAELYSLAMTLTADDSETAAILWDDLMAIWEQIYAEEEAGTLTLTDEEYDNIDNLTDEVYYYFVETVGYDPYGVATADDSSNSLGAAPTTTTNIKDITDEDDIVWSYNNVSYADGEFTLQYTINFSGLTYEDVTDNGEAIYIKIELGDIVPTGISTDYMYTAKDGNTDAFNYWFYKNDDGTYYIVMKVVDTYLGTIKDSTSGGQGHIDFWSNSVDVGTDGGVSFETETSGEVTIPSSEINHASNETWTSDITVTKSSSSYDLVNNTITYTVYVSSIQGTDTITLTDLLSGFTGLTITGIEVTSVKYQQDTSGYGSYGALLEVTEVNSASSVSSSTGTTYYYESDESTGSLTVVLSPLEGIDEDLTTTTDYTLGDRYVITYTVTFDPASTEISTTITNTATGTSHDDSIDSDIYSTATSSRKVTASVVDKSGTYSSGEIVWTIDFNPYGANITGYTLTDTKLATAVANGSLKITYGDNDTEAVYGTDYEYVYTNGVITGITFLTSGDTRHYTITYTEAVSSSLGSAAYSTNTVEVTDGNGNGVTSDTEGVTVPASETGELSKRFDHADVGSEYMNIYWTSSLTVSEGMLTKDTTITDNLGASSGDTSYRTADEAGQWFTRTQIVSLYSSIANASEDGTTGLVFVDGDTTYVVGSSVIYVIVTDGTNTTVTKYEYAEQYPDADPSSTQYGYFYMQAYVPNDTTWGTGTWVDLSTIMNDESYADTLFTAYRIVFNVDLTSEPNVSGTATITYATTASSDVATSSTFYNRVAVGNLAATAEHTEYNEVYKTDGSGVQGNSATTTSDGTLTWKVKVYVAYGSTQTFSIVDTLPSEISFESAKVEVSYHTGTIYASDADGVTGEATITLSNGGSNVTGTFSTDYKILAIDIDSEAYSALASSANGGYITITYTCKIDDFNSETFNATTNTYTNTVDVTYGGATYGSDDQTQTVIYEEDSSGTATDYLDKSGTWTNETNTLSYEVTFNLDREALANGEALTLTDVLETNRQYEDSTGDGDLDYLRWGVFASLDISSVKFYQLYELTLIDANTYSYVDSDNNPQTYTTSDISTDTNIYTVTDSAGNVTYYLKEATDIVWVYTENIGTRSSWSTTTHTITATIPDSTAILFVYTYDIEYINNYDNSTDMTTTISNSVSVNGEYSESDDNGEKIDHNNYATSGSMSTDSLTIYKVDSTSTGTLLSGAVYDLYKYDGTDWVNTGIQYTTGSDGRISISKSSLEVNTAYYIVESEAPDGYVLDSTTKYYFYASDSTVSETCYPSGWLGTAYTGVTDISTATRIFYAANEAAPTTTLTLTKNGVATVVDAGGTETEVTTLLSGAVFTLYYYSGSEWVETSHTYTTDSNGQISVSYSDGYYTFAQAYKLVETTAPDGYAIDSSSTIYFCWADDTSSYATGSLVYTYSQLYPSGWSSASGNDGTSISSAIDLATTDGTATVTNTQIPTTSVTVNKAWVNEKGITADPESGAYAQVQLYYYLGDTIEVDTGGTSGIPIYFGGSSLGWEQTLNNVSGVPSCYLANKQTYTITINVTSSAWFNLTTYSYTYTNPYSDDWWCYVPTNVDSGSSSSPYTVTFTASDSFDLYQVAVSANGAYTIDSIVVSYTDSTTSVEYTNTYSNDEWTGWVTAGGAGGGTGGGTTDTYTYKDLTGVVNSTGQAYLDENGDKVIVTLTSGNNWTYDIDNLPKYVYSTDANGKLVKQYYYYYFVEVAANGADVNYATYSQADGVPGSTSSTDDDPTANETEGRVITITNTVGEIEETYELPSAGGVGRTVFYVIGGMLIALAAGVLARKKRNCRS